MNEWTPAQAEERTEGIKLWVVGWDTGYSITRLSFCSQIQNYLKIDVTMLIGVLVVLNKNQTFASNNEFVHCQSNVSLVSRHLPLHRHNMESILGW